LGTPDCFFLPISNCSVPSIIDGKQTVRIAADFGHWVKPIIPPIFQNQSFNWYRSQLIFYLMRYNPQTLNFVHNAISQQFQPPSPSLDLHRPYVAVYIRRSDKITGREMTHAYPLQQYFDLFDNDAHRAKIKTVYINSEDEKVFSEFEPINKNKEGYYKLLTFNATRNVVFMAMNGMPLERREKIILEFLTDLFIEVNADLHAGTLTSNWCRLVDEIKLAIGKVIPYYTPENRFIIDV
jgi:hypothetical protein